MKERINIGICGLGLIGGSLAKAFRKRCGAYIVALDMDNKSIEKALAEKSSTRERTEIIRYLMSLI